MPQIQTLSSDIIANRKAETRNSQSLRKTVAIRDIQLINDTTIEYQGKRLVITKDAFKGLMKMIGMSQTFASKFEKLFNPETKAKFINQMKNAMATQLNEMTIILSPTTKKVVGFSKKATDLISHDRFIGLTDRLVDQNGFEITNWGVDANNGSVTINAFNPKAQFGVDGVANEVFTAGLTMKNSPLGGIQVMPYVNRLWCANGCTTAMASESYALNDLSGDSMEKFFEHMSQLRKNKFIPTGFQDKVKQAINTPASMREMSWAHNQIKKHVGDKAESWIPLMENEAAYSKANIGIVEPKSAKSNQSIWSVVNGMTHVATHAPDMFAIGMQDKDSTELMVQAGNLLGRQWNLQGATRSPFAEDAHMDTVSQVGAMLN
ncbi:MAG: hypothetical protein CMC65_07270 [Flavobacteriaceae bacterium]|jgi:hypothetical protein|nr:hypothetical protein [Flavobacteriaceae bacterium]|tara:strand:- start:238 stop:1368 length:1131 start_codon:yes stop_codon:yes gene_type:complete